MAQSSRDENAAFKLSQICSAVFSGEENIKIIEKILERQGDINFAIPVCSSYRFSMPKLIGNTALHLACNSNQFYTRGNIDLFNKLLNCGADFTKKNKQGQTVLHMINPNPECFESPLDCPFVNAVLSAHKDSNNFLNPRNKDGLSHFHIACVTDSSAAVQFFLDNGVSVDESVSIDAQYAAGYTPLHFAATSTNTKVVEVLLAHGANKHAKDASGMTVLHVLIKQLKMLYVMKNDAFGVNSWYEKVQELIGENEKIINMLLENMTVDDHDYLDSIGLSTFHVACMLQDTSAAKHLADRVTDLDHCINLDSKLWPGYTALHFAAHVSIDTVEMLIKKGANIEARDLEGLTPLDICMERYKIEDICRLMSLHGQYESLLFSDGKTKLMSFMLALTDQVQFEKFVVGSNVNMNIFIPMESILWPGCTPLHLAVLCFEKSKMFYGYREARRQVEAQMIKLCLSRGTDLSVQDSRGQTALHLAFRLNKVYTVEAILQHCRTIPNVLDEDNLSHLHIFSAVSMKSDTFEKCVFNSSEVNVAYKGTSPIKTVSPGSTPLHVCVRVPDSSANDVQGTVKILLQNGADSRAKDAYGLTPVHWLLDYSISYKARKLLIRETKDCVAEEYGLSHLHVACHSDDVGAARRLLENGANPNLAIRYTRRGDDDPLSFLGKYDKYTPLHFYRSFGSDMVKLLLEHGADVFAQKATDGLVPLDNSILEDNFVSKVWSDVDLQRRLGREFGWTRLHIACYLLQIDGFEDLVKAELADVNARVHSSSPIWGGYTPLHLLTDRAQNSVTLRRAFVYPSECYGQNYHDTVSKTCAMSRVLLEHAADVAVTDDQRNTPVGMPFNEYFKNEKLNEHAALLMRHHRDFSVNPVNAQGVSHFHAACFLNDVDAVRGFLEHGVEVNRPVDYFANWNPGCTPLHLASKLPVVELLIDHGGDVHIEDIKGRTALHKAVEHNVFDEDVITKIIESGADINALNFRGKTPFEIAISNGEMTLEKLIFCIRQGFVVNSCNPVTGLGYVGIIIGKGYKDKSSQLRVVERIINENSTAILGRTTLHHFATRLPQKYEDRPISLMRHLPDVDYNVLLEKLIKSGLDIDQQDEEGKTPLHLASESENENALCALLRSGADINVLDAYGNSAFSYIPTSSCGPSSSIKVPLTVHARRLVLLKLHLSKINIDAIADAPQAALNYAGKQEFYEAIARSKEIKLEVRSMCLYDFLSETNALTRYRSLNQEERCIIDRYFESIDTNTSLAEIKCFLKLQYRYVVMRIGLLPSATNSFRRLLGFDLPDLCTENIFKYLRNPDLKNVIRAEIENEDMNIGVDHYN